MVDGKDATCCVGVEAITISSSFLLSRLVGREFGGSGCDNAVTTSALFIAVTVGANGSVDSVVDEMVDKSNG